MRRAAAIALAALASVPGTARAQFRARPMLFPAPASVPQGEQTITFAAPFAGGASADLLLARSGAAASLRPHGALLAPRASPYAQPTAFACAAAGLLAQNGGDAAPDVAYCAGQGQIQIAFGSAPGTLRSYAHALSTIQAPTLSFVHLLPRQPDVIALPVDTGQTTEVTGLVYALDFGATAAGPLAGDRSWPAGGITKRGVLPDEVLPIRLGAAARARGVDDLYLPGWGSVTILANETPATATALADLALAPKIRVGGSGLEPGVDPATFLPAGMVPQDVLGAAPLDVDFDGVLDLVLSMSPAFRYNPDDFPTGRLLWVKGTGAVADFATTKPWGDLTGHPDLQPLVDPSFLRAIELGGEPALAVFDRGGDAVLVVRSDRAARRLRVWRGSAAGRHLRDFRLADVAGSTAPDLFADGTWLVDPMSPQVPPAILVWPDAGDASPELAWAPGSPGAPLRGEDHPLAVTARDADGTFTVDWMLGDPYGAPAATASGLAAGAAHEVPWAVDGALLCDPPPQSIDVTVRATDALGVFDELSASLQVAFGPPALGVAGAVPPDRLALPPGGTVAALEGSAWTRCGPVAFTWGGSIFAAAAVVASEDGTNTTRRILDLPESSYPALLAGAPDATLLAADPATGLESPPASLAIALDARGLVEAEHATDGAGLAPGEVAVVRTTLRSRVGVALAGVRVVDVLAGLAPAGPPRVTGATIVATGAEGAEVVLDALPPAGGEVTIELPVRSLGTRGASAVEARSSGGYLLSPGAAAPAAGEAVPGCGCRGGAAGLEALLALAAAAALRRAGAPRYRARPRR